MVLAELPVEILHEISCRLDHNRDFCAFRICCKSFLGIESDVEINIRRIAGKKLRKENVHLDGARVLQEAAANGDLEIVRTLVKMGLGLDNIRKYTNLALRKSAENGHLHIVRYLVEQGLSMEDVRSNGNEAFLMSAENGRLDVVRFLISLGLSIEDIRTLNNYALRICAAKGHLETVRYLLGQGLSFTDVCCDRNYVLKITAARRDFEMFRFLVNFVLKKDCEVTESHDELSRIMNLVGRDLNLQKDSITLRYLLQMGFNLEGYLK